MTLLKVLPITQGTASTNAELEEVMIAIGTLKVLRMWGKTYPSQKPLGCWIVDLQLRVEFYVNWIDVAQPKCWWLPALTYPTGFLTAILQVSARMNGVYIDSLSFETPVLHIQLQHILKTVSMFQVYILKVLLGTMLVAF